MTVPKVGDIVLVFDGLSDRMMGAGTVHEIVVPAVGDLPSLVIVGDQDHGTPPDMARQIHANLRGSELLIIPSAAHLSNVEQPEAFNTALLLFLGKVSR